MSSENEPPTVPLTDLATPVLVTVFRDWVVTARTHHLEGRIRAGNRLMDRYLECWKEIRARGDAGRDALAVLLDDDDETVRLTCACILLRHRHDQARAILEALAPGQSLAAYGARMTLGRWNRGEWTWDPPDPQPLSY